MRSSLAKSKKARTKNISKRAQKIEISSIKEMSMLADIVKERGGPRIISFGQGIPYFDTPDHIKQGIIESLKQPDTKAYTLMPGINELRDLIGKDLKTSKGIKNIQPRKQIMITIGCQEAIACALSAVIDEGDEVILFTPGFPSHIAQVIHFGGKPKFAGLDEKNDWAIDFTKLEKMVTKKTKTILLSNPSNPTGKVLTVKEAKALASFAKKHDLIMISDETYDFLTYDNTPYFSLASLPGLKDRIILCGSFSKKYALTGYRVGYAFAEEGIISQMMKIHDALAICAPAISQKAAIAALKGTQTPVADFVRGLAENREKMCARLDRLNNIFSYQKPMGAYYIFVKYNLPKYDSRRLAIKILNEAHLAVIPGEAFGPTGEGHLRFSFGCTPQDIDEGFDRLEKWSKGL
ncbi:MAG: pyridoxal phosphate-dependent aminotransferase [Candidatus Paceibacterota bacterium]|jgi:aminotransferase